MLSTSKPPPPATKPPPPAAEAEDRCTWIRFTDDYGCPYYYRHGCGKSRRSLGPDRHKVDNSTAWVQYYDDEDCPYYYNSITDDAVEKLPYGTLYIPNISGTTDSVWEFITRHGLAFFFNRTTGEMSVNLPRGAVAIKSYDMTLTTELNDMYQFVVKFWTIGIVKGLADINSAVYKILDSLYGLLRQENPAAPSSDSVITEILLAFKAVDIQSRMLSMNISAWLSRVADFNDALVNLGIKPMPTECAINAANDMKDASKAKLKLIQRQHRNARKLINGYLSDH